MSCLSFTADFNEALVHQVVTSIIANGHKKTKAQKTRSEVSGGGKKPFAQKGTGRARAGTIRSPLWRGGGRTFAARPGGSSQKVNKKMYRAAMRSVLAELDRQERLVVADLAVKQPRTKEVVAILAKHNVSNALLVTDTFNADLFLAARNIPGLVLLVSNQLNPVSLLRFEKVLITSAALQQLEGVFA